MKDPGTDALAASASNRGLELMRSRIRTPGKRRFGKVGLVNSAGEPVFGMDAKGPNAKVTDVEAYLRKLVSQEWSESLGKPKRRRSKSGQATARGKGAAAGAP